MWLHHDPAEHARFPRWSPDGHWVAFFGHNPQTNARRFLRVPATGGPAVAITEPDAPLLDKPPGYGWSADGKSIVYRQGRADESQVWVVPVNGGEPVHIAGLDGYEAGRFRFGPGGKTLVFSAPIGVWGSWQVWTLENYLPDEDL